MNHTHRKKAYTAECMQWNTHSDKDNIIQTLQDHGYEVTQYGHCIMIRYNDGRDENSIDTMYIGDWLVTGENGNIKRYTDDVFNIKYEEK